jgi:hypothetical protein
VSLICLIDVDEQHGERGPVAPGRAEGRVKDLVQIAAVTELGQRIDASEPVQL